MKRHYQQLTSQERDQMAVWLAEGHGVREIGRRLDRCASTISREVERNGPRIRRRAYLSQAAQRRSEQRRRVTHQRARLKEEGLRQYVMTRLRRGWSPELIAGRLREEVSGLRISHEAIYQWLYADQPGAVRYLPRHHRRRKRKPYRKKPVRCSIPHRVSIDERPQEIATRQEAGHWELDTAFFHHCPSLLVVMTERKTRFTQLAKLPAPTAEALWRATVQRQRRIPRALRKSFTYDNGRENTRHMRINTELGTTSYFCHPGCSWEKGTVENTIGLLRRLLPKSTSLEHLPDEVIARVERWLNTRPRKCLGFKTPKEAFIKECCT